MRCESKEKRYGQPSILSWRPSIRFRMSFHFWSLFRYLHFRFLFRYHLRLAWEGLGLPPDS
jgi:hypothetical protein